MSEGFIGEIRMFSSGNVPQGWAPCNGQLLPISQYQALFSLLGIAYGGDGRSNFALPNLQGRLPVHVADGIALGQTGGELTHTLTVSETPAHIHLATADASLAEKNTPPGPSVALAQSDGGSLYADDGPLTSMSPSAISTGGDSQPHENCMPYLTVTFCIALRGEYPQRA